MLLYESAVRDEFKRVYDLAERIRAKFDTGAKASELPQDLQLLDAAYEQLKRLLPVGVSAGNIGRHLGFLKYYLEREKVESCRGDIRDICLFDLPALEQSFRDWCASQQHYDAEFAEKVGELLRERYLDSAVRKGFVVLKERLVRSFDVPGDVDGRELVNQVFGGKGYLSGKIPESEREAMRNLLDGLFGVFRNVYGHRDVEPDWYEVEAILAMINWSLKRIETYPSPVVE